METENEPAMGIEIRRDNNGNFTYDFKEALEGKSFQQRHYWLPIPRSEILSSNNQLEQNPEYN